jgi:peroxiredoxin
MTLINDNSKVLSIGDPMPNFTLPAVDGLTITAADIKDPVLCIIFTCNHCPYAKAYEDHLVELGEDIDQEGGQIILINSNDSTHYPEDDFEHMQKKAEEKHYPFPYCHDESQEVAKAYGALCTPHCFVFDAERKLRYKGCIGKYLGKMVPTTKGVSEYNLSDACHALLDGKEPPENEVNAIGCSIKWKEAVEA